MGCMTFQSYSMSTSDLLSATEDTSSSSLNTQFTDREFGSTIIVQCTNTQPKDFNIISTKFVQPYITRQVTDYIQVNVNVKIK